MRFLNTHAALSLSALIRQSSSCFTAATHDDSVVVPPSVPTDFFPAYKTTAA